jgi:hypothetical protein
LQNFIINLNFDRNRKLFSETGSRTFIRETNIIRPFLQSFYWFLPVACRGYISSAWSCKEAIPKILNSDKAVLLQSGSFWCTWSPPVRYWIYGKTTWLRRTVVLWWLLKWFAVFPTERPARSIPHLFFSVASKRSNLSTKILSADKVRRDRKHNVFGMI